MTDSKLQQVRQHLADIREAAAAAEFLLDEMSPEAAKNVPAGRDPRVPEDEDDGA